MRKLSDDREMKLARLHLRDCPAKGSFEHGFCVDCKLSEEKLKASDVDTENKQR
jgi:hypothetical protein